MKDNPISKEDTAKIQKDIIKGDNPKAQIPEKVSEKQDNKEKSQYIPIRITSTPKQNMEIETHNRYNPLVDIDPETTLFKIPHTGNINQTTAPPPRHSLPLRPSPKPPSHEESHSRGKTPTPLPRKIEIIARTSTKNHSQPDPQHQNRERAKSEPRKQPNKSHHLPQH